MESWGPIPRRDPLSYPGTAPSVPVLVTLGRSAPSAIPIATVAGGSLAEAMIDSPGQVGPTQRAPLRQFLEAHHLPALHDRIAVLAIGSNASLAQMAHKYIRSPRTITYVQVPVAVSGLGIAYAPMISRYGAVPATIVPSPGTLTTLALQYLDPNDIEALDATEGGYTRLTMRSNPRLLVTLPTGESVTEWDVYVANSGFLSDSGVPLRLGYTRGELDQVGVLAHLLGVEADAVRRLYADLVVVPTDASESADASAVCGRVRQAIDTSAMATPNPLLPARA